MPEFSPEFMVALLGVVLADLVLAGDNAVVIALAARNLPKELRRKAVFYGAGAAILLRAGLTIAAVYLLHQELPFVQLVGGVALLWIAWKLAVEEPDDHEGIDTATTLRGAIQTILVADVVMSIDNVLAVAAIARNDIWLVIFGLLLSIPIIMGGASLLLRVIDRFPIITWIGAALIAYVGFELMLVDPATRDYVHDVFPQKWMERLTAVTVAAIFIGLAWYRRTHDDDGPPDDRDRHDSEPTPPTDPATEPTPPAGSNGHQADGPNPRLMVEASRSDD
ncbi:MAG: Membrane protein TerC family, involved in tellurium resistance [Thermoleophilia bacterium]|nr:Membrane protein TerC family, involved in tellurium resistance [Thermoleophilia bacterium]